MGWTNDEIDNARNLFAAHLVTTSATTANDALNLLNLLDTWTEVDGDDDADGAIARIFSLSTSQLHSSFLSHYATHVSKDKHLIWHHKV